MSAHLDETARQRALDTYRVVDSFPEAAYDDNHAHGFDHVRHANRIGIADRPGSPMVQVEQGPGSERNGSRRRVLRSRDPDTGPTDAGHRCTGTEPTPEPQWPDDGHCTVAIFEVQDLASSVKRCGDRAVTRALLKLEQSLHAIAQWQQRQRQPRHGQC